MKSKKSLAKVFGPVLLLTASLALPMDTFAAPQGRGRAAAEDKADKNDKQGKHRQNRAQQRRVEQKKQEQRQQAVRRQRSQRPQVKQQQVKRQQVKQQAAVRQNRIELQRAKDRQAALRQQRIQQQQASQRQRALEQQRALERQRLLNQQAYSRQQALERQRAVELQRRNRANTGYYNTAPRQGGGGGADRSVFHIDGYLQGGRDCMIVRDHDGRIWSLVGNTYGLGEGEHVRLYGRIVDGGACGWEGTSFDIYEVRTVWADDRHRTTYYDHLHDGPFDSNADYDQYGDDYDDRDDDRSWFDKLFGG